MRYLTRSRAAALVLLALAAGSCKRTGYDASTPLVASPVFDNASPEAREALAVPVDFRLTDDNFAQWEDAQSSLDDIPRSEIGTGAPAHGTAVDRAVARLESSASARSAIERAGLSVREFVLETIALAQAVAAETGNLQNATPIPPENFEFVQRYRVRVLLAEREDRLAREQAEAFDMRVDPAEQGDPEMNMQMDEADAGRASEMRGADDTVVVRDTLPLSAPDTIPAPR